MNNQRHVQQKKYFVVDENGEALGQYVAKNARIAASKAFSAWIKTLSEEEQLIPHTITVRESLENGKSYSFLATRRILAEPETKEITNPRTGQKMQVVYDNINDIKEIR